MSLDRSSATAFGRVAESYERSRPTYPPELIAWLTDRLELGPGKIVVDLGAGTGKLTRAFVPTGARVIAVEPLDEMRAQLEAVVPGAESLTGTAEAIPLADGSADAVTAASAFHWFDLDRALPEIHRVLKPGGALAVIGNGRDLDDSLQTAVQEIVGSHLPNLDELLVWTPLAASRLFGPLETFETTHEQLFDADGLAERVGTISYVARLPHEERAEVLARVRALGAAQPTSPFSFRYRLYASVCYAVVS